MLKSLSRLLSVDPGLRSESVLTAKLFLPRSRYQQPGDETAFYAAVMNSLRGVPGIASASLVSSLPMADPTDADRRGFILEGKAAPAGGAQAWDAPLVQIEPDYFETMGIPFVEGRRFDDRDGLRSDLATIVNERFVERFLSSGEAVGQRIRRPSDDSPWMTIVGVVGNVRREGLEGGQPPLWYVPHAQGVFATRQLMRKAALVVRSETDSQLLTETMRRAVREIDSEVPLTEFKTMSAVVDGSVASRRFVAWLLGGFAGMALLLSAIGVYGVMSYWVATRRREIGIRMAIGARAGRVGGAVVGQGLVLAVSGVGVGTIVALATTRALSSVLYEVSPTDVTTYLAVALLLTLVAATACWVPALRAARIDPAECLREE